MGYLRKKHISQEEAEEAVQSALLYIWKANNHDKSLSSFHSYLCKIAMRKWIDQVPRKQHLNHDSLENMDAFISLKHPRTYCEEVYETKKILNRRVSKLPKDQQEILHLVYGRGMTFNKAAEYLSMPLGTIKSSISRALVELRKEYRAA